MIARAKAIRFFIPPDICEGNLSSIPFNPTRFNPSSTFSRICLSVSLECWYNMKPTFSPTVMLSNKAALWNTIPTRRFRFSSASPSRVSPIIFTVPLSGISSPAMIFNTVLFPVPDGPMIPTASPLRILKLAPANTDLLPNDLCTSFTSMSTSSSPVASVMVGTTMVRRWCRSGAAGSSGINVHTRLAAGRFRIAPCCVREDSHVRLKGSTCLRLCIGLAPALRAMGSNTAARELHVAIS
mmetsp:Transcript_27175/g.45458  ORF Transcript_27175/g.45458 Transcript_27175/m.45458 type:complete len:240 (+) Transcript_27175:435-1154(+)